MSDDSRPVLLYDGVCGFCDRTVTLILRVDRRGVFRFAPLQGDFAGDVMSRHPRLQDIHSLVLVEPAQGSIPEAVYVRSGAFIRTASHLGGAWRLLIVSAVIPRPFRDWAYDIFARHRYRMFGRFETCPLPSPGERLRFLD
jgi:predicted DCC family thiol-disulfide oxidoreductase YuxK